MVHKFSGLFKSLQHVETRASETKTDSKTQNQPPEPGFSDLKWRWQSKGVQARWWLWQHHDFRSADQSWLGKNRRPKELQELVWTKKLQGRQDINFKSNNDNNEQKKDKNAADLCSWGAISQLEYLRHCILHPSIPENSLSQSRKKKHLQQILKSRLFKMSYGISVTKSIKSLCTPPENQHGCLEHPPWMKMYFLLKMGDFPVCHVSELRGVITWWWSWVEWSNDLCAQRPRAAVEGSRGGGRWTSTLAGLLEWGVKGVQPPETRSEKLRVFTWKVTESQEERRKSSNHPAFFRGKLAVKLRWCIYPKLVPRPKRKWQATKLVGSRQRHSTES